MSGTCALAANLGADCSTVEDGQILKAGDVSVRVIATPGHTPGSVCFLVADRYLLSGDTLFTKALGRPDLGGHVVEWSRDLFKTLTVTIAACRIRPGFCRPTTCGRVRDRPDGVVSAELETLRKTLPEFNVHDREVFSKMMQDAVRTPPAKYSEIIDLNTGRSTADVDHIVQLELGKNEVCRRGAHK